MFPFLAAGAPTKPIRKLPLTTFDGTQPLEWQELAASRLRLNEILSRVSRCERFRSGTSDEVPGRFSTRQPTSPGRARIFFVCGSESSEAFQRLRQVADSALDVMQLVEAEQADAESLEIRRLVALQRNTRSDLDAGLREFLA